MTEFRDRLAELGITQIRFRNWIEEITGRKLAQTTTSRWATGDRRTPTEILALLAVIEHPALLVKLDPYGPARRLKADKSTGEKAA